MKKLFLSIILPFIVFSFVHSQEKHQFNFPDDPLYVPPGHGVYALNGGNWTPSSTNYYEWIVSQNGNVTLNNLGLWIGSGSTNPGLFGSGNTYNFRVSFDVPSNASPGSIVDINVLIREYYSQQQVYSGRYRQVITCYPPTESNSSYYSNSNIDIIAQEYVELLPGFSYTTNSSSYEFNSYTESCEKQKGIDIGDFKSIGFENESNSISQYDNSKLLIYPNPSLTGQFNVDGIDETTSIEVFNCLGKIIYEKFEIKDNFKFDLSGQPEGVYFVNIRADNTSVTKKIVIAK